MTDYEKIHYLLSVIREARIKVLEGDLREVWNSLYLPPEVEQTRRTK